MYTLLIILQIYNKYPTKNNLMGEKNTFITFIKLEVGHFFDVYGWHALGRIFRFPKGDLTAEVTSNSGETRQENRLRCGSPWIAHQTC